MPTPTFSPALAPTAEMSMLSAAQTQQAAAAIGTANAAVFEVTQRAAEAQLQAAQFAASATAAQVTANVQATDHALGVQATATAQALSGTATQAAADVERTQTALMLSQTAAAAAQMATATQGAASVVSTQQAGRAEQAQMALERERRLQSLYTWSAGIGLVVLLALALIAIRRGLLVLELRGRALGGNRATGDKPLMMLEAPAPLPPHPSWFERAQWLVAPPKVLVAYDADRNFGPAAVIVDGGNVTAPLMAPAPEWQERVTAHDQQVDGLRSLPRPAADRSQRGIAPPSSASLRALPAGGGESEIVEGEFREVGDSGPVAAWLDEVVQKVLEGGDTEDGHPDDNQAGHARNP